MTTTDSIEFSSNGDVLRIPTYGFPLLIGRIDSEGDWRPEPECPWSEDELRAEIVRQVEELGDSYTWPIEQLSFAGII
jgi:hypothetical protein